MLSHPADHEYAWAARGAVEIQTPAGTFRADENWALWIPAGTPHTIRPVDDTVILLPILLPSANFPDWFGETTPLARDERSDRLAARAAQPAIHGPLTARREAHVLHALLGSSRQGTQGAAGASVTIPREDPARTVALAILRDPGRQEHLEQWAAMMHVSTRTLQRSFTAQTGISFRRWRTRVRVRTAVPMLRNGMTVAEAATGVGFASSSAFSAACRTEIGATPGRLRRTAIPA